VNDVEEKDDGLRVFAGIDWSTTLHAVSLVNDVGKVLLKEQVADTSIGFEKLCALLVEKSGLLPQQIGVAIEVSRGRLVEGLIERGFSVFGINPKQLDRFRDRFGVAGAKDDDKDAFVLASSLRTDRRCFRRLEIDEPLVVELREWSRELQGLRAEHTRITNQMRDHLRRYFPQLLDVDDDVSAPYMLDLFSLTPTPGAAQKIKLGDVATLVKRYRIRKHSAEEVLALLQQKPLFVAPGTIPGVSARVRHLVARVRLLMEQLKAAEANIDRICGILAAPVDDASAAETVEGQKGEHRDAAILLSLAGVGRIVCATLLAEAAQAIRERDYHALRLLTGVAPVTRASGKGRGVLMRRACHPRLREALYHWARVATVHDERARAHYAALRAKGKSHGRAIRGVGDRLLKVACVMLREGTLYDENKRRLLAA